MVPGTESGDNVTLEGMPPAARGSPSTERLFAGETDAESLIRAQAWVHKHYEVLAERGPEGQSPPDG